MAKKAASGAGSIRKKAVTRAGKAYTYWEARYTIGYDPATGKQVQKSVSGKTQKEVRLKLQQITMSIDNKLYIEPTKLCLSQWIDAWLCEYCEHIKASTKEIYRQQVKKHLSKIGAVKLSALDTHTIQKLYNTLQRDGLKPKTIKNIHFILHRALEQALELGYIARNPAKACKPPRVEKPNIKPLADNETAAFIKAIKGHRFENLFLTDVFTGLRKSELLGLTWDCVDFENGTIRIYQQLQKVNGAYQFTAPKNGKSRIITPAPYVIQVLHGQRRLQLSWKLKAGAVWQPWNGSDLVFTDELGGHLSHQTVYNNFKRIASSLGLPDLRFHDLRHTYAVACLQAGDNVKTVQENLGHHSAAFTLDTYAHVTERMKQESAARMEAYISSLTSQ